MKTILLTISATLVITVFAATLFLNTILGAFGLVSTSIQSLQSLKTSHQVVEKMKKRHNQKKLNVSKKFAKKSTRRVASTALAAATVGTVAVAVTMVTFEVVDYCEEKKELQINGNLLYGTNVEFGIERCFEEGKEDSKTILQESMDSSVVAVSNAFDETAKYSGEKWAAIREASVEAFQSTGEAARDLWDATYSWVIQ
jgi:hypothetical protein